MKGKRGTRRQASEEPGTGEQEMKDREQAEINVRVYLSQLTNEGHYSIGERQNRFEFRDLMGQAQGSDPSLS